MNKFFTLFLVNLLFTGLFAYAQPPAFTLGGTSVAQTCLGNGSISLTVSGNDPSATMEYAVYLLPNTTNPVTTVTTPQVTGLVAGMYQIIATQLLNGSSNTATAIIVVGDNRFPLQYTATGTYCNGDGTITINVSSGSAASYEILSGPVIRPLQPSNTFTGLPMGQYQVRVFDDCGEGVVTTVQLSVPSANLYFSAQTFESAELPSCSTIMVTNGYGNAQQMLWPVTFEYKVYPPGGGTPSIITATRNSYNQDQTIATEIPYYGDQQYTYNLTLTDACGNSIMEQYIVNEPLTLEPALVPLGCGSYALAISLRNYLGPYTVSFPLAPAGFVPSQFNSQHPSFDSPSIIYGSENNALPLGDYSIKITDACGRSVTENITISDNVMPDVETSFEGMMGCTGTIYITAPPGRVIVSGQITAGPPGFSPLPQDVSAYIVGDKLTIPGLPPGSYTIVFTDQCGIEYTVNATIIAPPVTPLFVAMLPGCGTGEGTFIANAYPYGLQYAAITQAPAGFDSALPFDVSADIYQSEVLSVGTLPAGTYHITVTDFCGNIREADVGVQGYEVYSNTVEVLRNCGSFDIDIHFSANTTYSEGFWLQAYNEETNTWGHPLTGLSSTEFNTSTGVFLYNNQVNYNFPFEGQFRIVHVFSAYSSGNPYQNGQLCSEEIYTFSYYDAPKILEAYAFPCANGLSEVIVYAEGTPPLNYQITEKAGQPFIINGQQNAFTGLEDATYTFTVTDACNNIVNRQYDITDLDPLEIIADGFCPGEAGSLSVREFSFLTYQWWKDGVPAQILSTTNELLFPAFDPQIQAGLYYLKIVSVTPGSCIDTVLQYTIVSPALPNSGNDISLSLCNRGQELDLATLLDAGISTGGVWQDTLATGALTGSVVSFGGLDAGHYEFTYTTSGCSSTDEAVVHLEVLGINSFPVTLLTDCVAGSYTIVVSNIAETGAATITWTGPNGYNYVGESANIDGLGAGTYTATVTNTSGCISTASVTVENTNCFIPRGVSPDDDGNNDSFDLSNLAVKHVEIFNRYGLQVYEKDNYINEWYGQSDKGDLPTGTYFYVITLADKQVTGWVYLMKRV